MYKVIFFFILGLFKQELLPNLIADALVKNILATNEDRNVLIIGPSISIDFEQIIKEKFAELFLIQRFQFPISCIADDEIIIFPIGDYKLRSENFYKFSEFNFDISAILDFLESLLPERYTVIDSRNFVKEVYDAILKSFKIPVVLFDPESKRRNLVYRSISARSNFTSDYQFFKYNDTKESLNKIFYVPRFPEVECFFQHTVKTDVNLHIDLKKIKLGSLPLNKPLNYQNIDKFLTDFRESELIGEFLVDREYYGKDNRTKDEILSDYNEMIGDYYLDNRNLLDVCKFALCVILFDKLLELPEPQFSKISQMVRELQTNLTYKSVKVVLIDAICHAYFMNELDIEPKNPPAAISFDGNMNYVAYFRQSLEFETLREWILSHFGEQPPWSHKIKEELKILKKECLDTLNTSIKQIEAPLNISISTDL